MRDLGTEPSMEDILSSIKRIIAEEGEPQAPLSRRMGRPLSDETVADDDDDEEAETVLELDDAAAADVPRAEAPRPEPQRATFAAADGTTDPDILSPRVAQATRGRLEALSRLIVKPDVAGSDTLEGLVREMLKPMLSEWLDANLPAIVETMVSREIARISGRNER